MPEIELRVHTDEAEKKVTFERVQDVEDIIERNKRLQNDRQKAETFHHIASIPNIFIERWLNEEWERGNSNLRPFTPEFDALVKRKLNDRDWLFLKTTDRAL